MNCFLYQLQFNTAVHFGSSDSALSLYHSEDHFRADTIFSALCHTALQLEGKDGINRLVKLTSNGKLLLSDGMPWKEKHFYLPRPVFSTRHAADIPEQRRKALKRLAWIQVEQFEQYCYALKSGTFYDVEEVSFGFSSEITKSKVTVSETERTEPYQVGLYRFKENSGLYFLVKCENVQDNEWLHRIVQALGVVGIGGKTGVGYGKFSVVQMIDLAKCSDGAMQWLNEALNNKTDMSVLLTTSLPTDEELNEALEGAYYQLVRRSGFVASSTYAESPRKKRTQYYLSAGSVLKKRFRGDLYDVGIYGAHPVYRYAKPIFLGVDL